MNQLSMETPIGKLTISERDGFITHVYFCGEESNANDTETPLLLQAKTQLTEYFNGTRKTFDLPIKPNGGEFFRRVWSKMIELVPYGQTASYGELAKLAGNEKASRAVGMANNRNPIPIIIPCHRIVGKNGKLTGFRGGLDSKQWLLEHEKNNLN
ncbi:MAG: methylated-DNA--[protein]-cysteine S-methyltransferase [Firmicutes bacterium]|nr:methylated-DNA--[protein]-cysteine S-methyltransferase [Bacillota bacterium]